MALVKGRISELGFKVSILFEAEVNLDQTDFSKVAIGVTFGITILSATVRLVVRLRYQKRLHLDDYLMIIACVFLISGTTLLYLGTSAIFFIEDVSLNGEEVIAAVGLDYFLKQLLFYQRINWAYLALTWATVFFVKFAFLAFFRHLLDRVPFMYKYWKVLVGFTTLVFAFAVCDGFIACPVLGLASGEYLVLRPYLNKTDSLSTVQCSANPARLQTALGIGATVISLDILTDVLSLSISSTNSYNFLTADSSDNSNLTALEGTDQAAPETWPWNIPLPQHSYGHYGHHKSLWHPLPWNF